jgi:hypothetical protein
MATPTIITATGKLTKRDGVTPETGTVVFQAPGFVRSVADKEVISPGKTTAVLDEGGEYSVPVFACNDPVWNSRSWSYTVIVNLSESRDVFYFSIPYNQPGLTIDFSEMAPEPPEGGTNYALLNHTHAGIGAHTHPISEIIDLETQLAGLQPAGSYLVAADITNLVSSESLSEGLNLKLDKASPELVNTTLVIRKGDNSAALRFRATGGAVDIDKSAGNIYISSFAGSGPDPLFGGAQINIARLRGNGVTLAGRTEFGTTADASEMFIDAATGVASLGSKNSFPNVPIVGRRTVGGPPVTGTWALNDAVLATDGWWICTGAGTPGTWTQAAYPGGGLRSGSRYAPVGGGFAASTIALNEIRYVPIDIKANCTITELAAEVTTAGAATAVARFIVAKADPITGRPSGTLTYVSAQVATTATGKISVTPTLVLTAGRHFFAILPQVVIASFRSITNVPAMYEQPTLTTFHRSCYSEYGVTGNPTTVGTLSMDAGDAPRVEALIA